MLLHKSMNEQGFILKKKNFKCDGQILAHLKLITKQETKNYFNYYESNWPSTIQLDVVFISSLDLQKQ